jgi:hypothetical protein
MVVVSRVPICFSGGSWDFINEGEWISE